jgi:hypothetical protein
MTAMMDKYESDSLKSRTAPVMPSIKSTSILTNRPTESSEETIDSNPPSHARNKAIWTWILLNGDPEDQYTAWRPYQKV